MKYDLIIKPFTPRRCFAYRGNKNQTKNTFPMFYLQYKIHVSKIGDRPIRGVSYSLF